MTFPARLPGCDELAAKRAPKTVMLYLAVLTRMLRWAMREDHALTVNPAAELAGPLGLSRDELRVTEEALAFDRAQLARFLAVAREETPWHAGIFFLQARTGTRPVRPAPCSGPTTTPAGSSCGFGGPSG